MRTLLTIKNYLIIFVAILAVCIFNQNAQSRNAIAIEWQDYYGDSLSDDNLKKAKKSLCLLCHIKPEGGEPWNAYGWVLRGKDVIDEPEQAFKSIEQDNSDFDKIGLSNIFEISKGSQPGWNKHEKNWSYYKDGTRKLAEAPKGMSSLD